MFGQAVSKYKIVSVCVFVLTVSSQVAMFADDTKIFKSIASINDTKLLQQDLSNLESWSSTSGLPFNQSKCRSLSITRKTDEASGDYIQDEG